MSNILVIDDDRSVRHIITQGLTGFQNFEVVCAADGVVGLELLDQTKPRAILLDIFLPDHHGLELFRKIKSKDSKVPVIFITGDTSSETAIQAMRAGAFDYLSKPLNIEQVRRLTASAVEARNLMDEPVALYVGDQDSVGEKFVGKSKTMIEVYKAIGRVAAQNVSVLIRGESGCGKELVARALVQHSDRFDKPFVAVNCAAIPDQLLESELFGHEKGAFTGAERRRVGRFEQCDGGTIFLDEIGDMSPVIQGKVLRLLQEQKFERVGGNEIVNTDVRIIAATNRPLEQMVANEEFREDLLYRLNGFTIQLPPLKERKEDIPLLLEYFLRRAKSDMSKPQLQGISPEALDKLTRYDWPGNVRQLQSVVRQSVLQTTGTVIGVSNLPDFIQSDFVSSHSVEKESVQSRQPQLASIDAADSPLISIAADESLSAIQVEGSNDQHESRQSHEVPFSLMHFIQSRLDAGSTNLYAEALEQMERRLFTKVLEATNGNQSKTAEILGITRGKVRDRIATFDIQLERSVSIGKS